MVSSPILWPFMSIGAHTSGWVPSDAVQRSIAIVEQDGDVVRIVGSGPRGRIEAITAMAREGESLILRNPHVEGAGPGALGVAELRRFIRELGRHQGARRAIVFRRHPHHGSLAGAHATSDHR